MDAQLKAKWVEALRSGQYEQGSMFLRRDGKHCCLGVLCEIAGLEITDGGGMVAGPYNVDDYEPLYELIGGREITTDLWRKNDGNGVPRKDFPAIADFIEANITTDDVSAAKVSE